MAAFGFLIPKLPGKDPCYSGAGVLAAERERPELFHRANRVAVPVALGGHVDPSRTSFGIDRALACGDRLIPNVL